MTDPLTWKISFSGAPRWAWQASLLDALQSGPVRRDRGMARAREHEQDGWQVEALAIIRAMLPGTCFTAEDVRARAGDPTSRGSFGALIHQALGARLIRDTGEWLPASRPAARGRRMPVWERT